MNLDWPSILGAIVPMYAAIVLAFASVRWWKIFTPEQCSGINKFVAKFSVPFLVLDNISSYNIYTLNFQVIAADFLQKFIILASLLLCNKLSKKIFSFGWVITLFSVSTVPNSLLMGVPLIQSMYGRSQNSVIIEIVVLQCVIWFNLLVALYEYRAARLLIAKKFPKTEEPVVGSLGCQEQELKITNAPEIEDANAPEIEDTNGNLNAVRTSSLHCTASVESFGSNQSVNRAATRNPSGKVGHAYFDIDVLVEPSSEPSLQQEITTPKSPTKNLDEGDGVTMEKPSAGVVIKHILITLWWKLKRNPMIYASVVGIVWSLIAFRFNIKMPKYISSPLKGAITLISKTGLGMAMFSLGLSIALEPKLVPCKISVMVMTNTFKFLAGPVVMAATSAMVGLRGTPFEAATVQAVVPSAVVCFIYAKQYNVHPEILSTSIVITTSVFLPIAIAYNLLLQKIS